MRTWSRCVLMKLTKSSRKGHCPTTEKGSVSVCDVCMCMSAHVCAWVCMYVHMCVDAFLLPEHCLFVGPIICNNPSFILSVTPCPINILGRFLVVTLPWWCKSKRHSLLVNLGNIELRLFTLLARDVPNNKPPRTPNWYYSILSCGKY